MIPDRNVRSKIQKNTIFFFTFSGNHAPIFGLRAFLDERIFGCWQVPKRSRRRWRRWLGPWQYGDHHRIFHVLWFPHHRQGSRRQEVKAAAILIQTQNIIIIILKINSTTTNKFFYIYDKQWCNPFFFRFFQKFCQNNFISFIGRQWQIYQINVCTALLESEILHVNSVQKK